MPKIKESLDNFMKELKKENPDANWGNLVTGIIILIVIAFLSVWYFGNPSGLNEDFSPSELSEQNSDAFASQNTNNETTQVLKGEGLWHVAKRVCGNGEAYNVLARANNLPISARLSEGQVLTVVCSK